MSTGAPISRQIGKIGNSLTAGLVVLSVFAVLATLLIRSTFVEYRETARAALSANAIFEDIFEARLAALKWRLAPSDVHVRDVQGNIDKIRSQTNGMGVDLQQNLPGLQTDLDQYEAGFANVLKARAEFDAIESKIQEAGLSARKALTEIMTSAYEDGDPTAAFHAGRAQESLMLGRYFLERFRRTEDTADLERSMAEMQSANSEIAILEQELQNPRRRELAETAASEIAKFLAAEPDILGALAGETSARQILDTLGPKIVSDVEAVIDAATDRQNTLGPRGQTTATLAVVIILLAAVAIVCLGLVISRRLSSRIAASIEASVQTMSRIAEGDLDAAVENADQENELGRMARALEVFKANGKAAIQAAEREKEAAEQTRLAEVREKEAEAERERVAAKQELALQEERARAEKQAAEEEIRKAEAARKQVESEAKRQAMVQSLSRSLADVVGAATSGDFSKRLNDDYPDAELAALASSVNELLENVDDGVSAAGAAIQRVANGDLTEEMAGTYQGVFKELQDNTNEMIASLTKLVGGISDSTGQLAHSSAELTQTSEALSKNAEVNAASVEETSASLEELSVSIRQVDQNISAANDNAKVAKRTATEGRAVATEAAEAMNKINESSAAISTVVDLINNISFQINLLALNAGVEAARAGEAGRGFAVVASEVRMLAQRASDAAKEISDVIASSDTAVSDGVSKVKNAEEALQKIADSVSGVSTSIEEVAVSISEQVRGINDINASVASIDQNTQKQAAAFVEVTSAGTLLAKEAEGLQIAASRFKTSASASTPVVHRAEQSLASTAKRPVAPSPSHGNLGNLAIDDEVWEDF